MHRFICALTAILIIVGCDQSPTDSLEAISDDYVEAWAEFYPSRALSAGRTESAEKLEGFSQPAIDEWVAFNRVSLRRLEALAGDAPSFDGRVDRRLLSGQIEHELYRWTELEAHRSDPQVYSGLANHALTPILVRQNLSGEDRILAVTSRLTGLQTLCAQASANLERARPVAVTAAVRDLRSTAAFFTRGLADALELKAEDLRRADLESLGAETADALTGLADRLETSPPAPMEDAYGQTRYARELALAYGKHMTPETLEQLAMTEIETVRGLMKELAAAEWKHDDGDPLLADFDVVVGPMLTEMEAANAGNQQAFLAEFEDLIDRSERFLEDSDLVDLPGPRTLFTALSPSHFAGAAVGGVYDAGPFDPRAETLFYLPTVPDSAPDDVKDGFYRSFNTAFNTMIITHEIYPGHYHQLKVSAAHPSRIRPLFVGNDFTEGWASFCEQLTLDHGWDDDRPLTRMAHLRKRLENAVRAYVSVQVHCRGWDRNQLHTFAVETGLLPPQFADNLWHRTMLSPIQLPSYFVGFRVFDDAYNRQRQSLGDAFSAKDFSNAVIDSGGVPLEFLDELLAR